MKIFKPVMKTAALVLVILWAVSLPAAGDFSNQATIAVDQTQTLNDRINAILDLGASENESASPILLKILRDGTEEYRIRTSAVLALANLGTPRTEIIATFEDVYHRPSTGNNLRYTILMSLGKMKAVESLSLLRTALSSSNSMIRLKGFQALGALGDEEALQVISDYLKTEEDYMVRAAAVRAAGQSRTAEAENILRTALSSDPSPLVRNNAAIMLGKFTTVSSETQSALEAARYDSSPVVRETVKGVLP